MYIPQLLERCASDFLSDPDEHTKASSNTPENPVSSDTMLEDEEETSRDSKLLSFLRKVASGSVKDDLEKLFSGGSKSEF